VVKVDRLGFDSQGQKVGPKRCLQTKSGQKDFKS